MRIRSFMIVLVACFTTSGLAQALGGDQFNYRVAQYVPPPPSPAERVRCKVRRPALNAASRRACEAISGELYRRPGRVKRGLHR
jgi:hypothetical protein